MYVAVLYRDSPAEGSAATLFAVVAILLRVMNVT